MCFTNLGKLNLQFFSSGQFLIGPQLKLTLKMVKIDSKIIILPLLSKCVKKTVAEKKIAAYIGQPKQQSQHFCHINSRETNLEKQGTILKNFYKLFRD